MTGTLTVLTAAEWLPLQAAHRERVDALISGHRARSGGQISVLEEIAASR